MKTPNEMATDLVQTIAKRATSGGLFDFNLAYAACLETILAYGNERAATERERCAKIADAQDRNAILATQADGEWARCAQAIAAAIRSLS